MRLSALKVLELNKKYNLVEGLSEREQFNPEGVDLELRIGRVEEIVGDSFLGVTERHSAKTNLIADIDIDGNKRITMKPGDYFLVKTIETVHCPKEKIKIKWYLPRMHIIPDIRPRVSLQKAGIGLDCSTTNPGYNGQLWFGIGNHSRHNFDFELGARMFKIYWELVIGNIKREYSGQHQGGRTTSQGEKERQT